MCCLLTAAAQTANRCHQADFPIIILAEKLYVAYGEDRKGAICIFFLFLEILLLWVCKGHSHPRLPVSSSIKVLSSSVMQGRWDQVCDKTLNSSDCIRNT